METANSYRNPSDVYIDVDIEFTFRLDSFRTKATGTGTGWKYIEDWPCTQVFRHIRLLHYQYMYRYTFQFYIMMYIFHHIYTLYIRFERATGVAAFYKHTLQKCVSGLNY